MNASRFETAIDEEAACAMPKLWPMLGCRVEVIALEAEPPAAERTSLDDFLAHRLKRPADVGPLTLEDLERAIERCGR